MTDLGVPDGGIDSGAQQTEDTSAGGNPAWNTIFEKIPSEFHGMIRPDLEAWDKNYQRDTQEVQAKYQPYADFINNGVAPDQISTALQLTALMESNPQEFFEKFSSHFGIGANVQGQGGAPEGGENQSGAEDFSFGDSFDITQDPRFQEVSRNQEVMAEFLAERIQKEQEQTAIAELDQEENALAEKLGLQGGFDEKTADFLWGLHNQFELGSLEEAYNMFQERLNQARPAPSAGSQAPNVFAPSGGVPSVGQPDVGKMSSKDTRNLVAEILKNANSKD